VPEAYYRLHLIPTICEISYRNFSDESFGVLYSKLAGDELGQKRVSHNCEGAGFSIYSLILLLIFLFLSPR